MKLTDIQTFIVGNPWKNWVFIKLHTDEGVYGIGEATAHRKAKMIEAAVLEYRRYYLGKSPFNIEDVNYELIKAGAPAKVRAAIDIACWDIIGKVLDQPVYNLIGGKFRDRVPAYANGWYQVDRVPEEFAERAQAVIAKGYRAMKFDPFGVAFERITKEEIGLSVAIVAAVREAVGPNVELFIECHGRFDPLVGAKIGKLMEPYDPGWFEEPVRSAQIENMAALNAKLTFPVAGDEGLDGIDDFLRFMQARAAQIIQPDPVTCGGISELKKICAIAQAHHIQVAPHNAQGPVCTAACFHVDASTPNIMIQEIFEDFATPFASKITDYPTEIVDGHIIIPDRPGLGLDLDEEEMAKYPYDESHFLDMFGKGGWEKRNLND
ncbi:MAG: hypothetical protein CME19_20835 [Gemmatimonadetes bacterium]|nr:hypothetical protein [Gemmatimonadota bacterium]